MNSAWAAENLLRDIETHKIALGYYYSRGEWAATREIEAPCGCIQVAMCYAASVELAVTGCLAMRPIPCNEEEDHG